MTACSTTTVIPIDDVYYTPAIENPAPKTQSTQSTPINQNTPSTQIEYLNVQDTTVTVRIKK